jgi:hypothetical protein
MASGKSNNLAKKIADVMYGAVAYTTVTPVFFALWTASLSATSTGSTAGEASYTGYARVSVTNNATQFPAATGSGAATKQNANAITWPQNSATVNTVISAAVCDASTTGNILHWGDIVSTVINVLDTPQIATNGFTLTES